MFICRNAFMLIFSKVEFILYLFSGLLNFNNLYLRTENWGGLGKVQRGYTTKKHVLCYSRIFNSGESKFWSVIYLYFRTLERVRGGKGGITPRSKCYAILGFSILGNQSFDQWFVLWLSAETSLSWFSQKLNLFFVLIFRTFLKSKGGRGPKGLYHQESCVMLFKDFQ